MLSRTSVCRNLLNTVKWAASSFHPIQQKFDCPVKICLSTAGNFCIEPKRGEGFIVMFLSLPAGSLFIALQSPVAFCHRNYFNIFLWSKSAFGLNPTWENKTLGKEVHALFVREKCDIRQLSQLWWSQGDRCQFFFYTWPWGDDREQKVCGLCQSQAWRLG